MANTNYDYRIKFINQRNIRLHCEAEVNECLPNPCLNNAVCEDQVGGFLCKCPPGFLGTRCGKNVDECLSQPCKNGATCKDGVNSFRQLFGTSRIQFEKQPSPVVIIKTIPFHPLLFAGKYRRQHICKQSTGFNLDFEVSGIYGYVLLDGVLPSLHAVTCTFWMKSSDEMNYGTPISYAVENGTNSLISDSLGESEEQGKAAQTEGALHAEAGSHEWVLCEEEWLADH
ncbi:hypothetical protein P7K49_001530 [Saguinus oedipus]|uniref:EGF-like domain-containing protein n=1 Tax=Saguinus oedipus TaxID=9490 RepID=A0ABQ9WGN4_SAGOE|nr:hypothetical protein P7K49_001530 [Saguinus oedipus]